MFYLIDRITQDVGGERISYGAVRSNQTVFGRANMQFGKAELVYFIRVENLRAHGISYFRGNPTVLSDIALLLVTRAFPNSTLQPLKLGDGGFW